MNKRQKRWEETQRKISGRVFELLEEINSEKIAVGDVCEYVKINRSTFYAHFGSVREVIDSGMSNFDMKVCNIITNGVRQEYQIDDIDNMINDLLVLVRRNTNIYLAWSVRYNKSISVIDSKLFWVLSGLLMNPERRLHRQLSATEVRYVISSFEGAVKSFLDSWIRDDFSLSRKRMIAMIRRQLLPVLLL